VTCLLCSPPPFLQALHFFIGFGALVSPLIADPFLSETGCGNYTNATEFTPRMHHVPSHSPSPGHNITGAEGEGSTVHYAFWIMAGINVRPTSELGDRARR